MQDVTSYDEWRNSFYKLCCGLTAIIFFVELVLSLLNYSLGLILISSSLYFIKFLILPTAINILSVFVCQRIMVYKKCSDTVKNHAACIMLLLICTCIPVIHYIFLPLLCAPCFAIFLSAVFGSKKLTSNIAILGFFSVTIAGSRMMDERGC